MKLFVSGAQRIYRFATRLSRSAPVALLLVACSVPLPYGPLLTRAALAEDTGVKSKTLTYSLDSYSATKDPYRLDLSGTLNRIVAFTADTDLFDPFTVAELHRTADEAAPRYDQRWEDADKLRSVTERAFGLTAAQNVVRTIETSDLRPAFLAVKDSMREVQRVFNFSLQRTDGALSVGRKVRGKKILELEVEFNARRLIDPHLKIGENVRVRYDLDNATPMFEYEIRY